MEDTTTKKTKSRCCIVMFSIVVALAMLHVVFKNQYKTAQYRSKNNTNINAPFWDGLGSQVGAKLLSRASPHKIPRDSFTCFFVAVIVFCPWLGLCLQTLACLGLQKLTPKTCPPKGSLQQMTSKMWLPKRSLQKLTSRSWPPKVCL